MTNKNPFPSEYDDQLQELGVRVRTAQLRTALARNRERVFLNWSIGKDILARQGIGGGGTRILDRLARDLQYEFPGLEDCSPRALKDMLAFAEAWPDHSIVQRLVAYLPWGHILHVLDRVEDRVAREWYLRAALELGWGQSVLIDWISRGLHKRV